jgi:hypothetical protein
MAAANSRSLRIQVRHASGAVINLIGMFVGGRPA